MIIIIIDVYHLGCANISYFMINIPNLCLIPLNRQAIIMNVSNKMVHIIDDCGRIN